MGKHHDWTDIRNDYQENGLSYAALAKKYGVPLDTLKKAAARQGWTKTKERRAKKAKAKLEAAEGALNDFDDAEQNGTENGTTENGTENGTAEMAPVISLYPDKILPAESDAVRFGRLVNDLMDRVEDAICRVDTTNASAVKLLASALKDLRDLKHLNKTELDIEEQKARIEKLRSETAIHSQVQEPIIVEFVNMDGAEQ